MRGRKNSNMPYRMLSVYIAAESVATMEAEAPCLQLAGKKNSSQVFRFLESESSALLLFFILAELCCIAPLDHDN